MVVCPICEHAQSGGSECEVCGRRHQDVAEPAPPIAALDGLESTLQPAASAAGTAAMPDLERTGVASVPPPPGMAPPAFEATSVGPVDLPVGALLGIERTGDGAPAEEPTPYPAVVSCRYCRAEADPGEKICNRCGMRLPTAKLRPPEAVGEEARMCSCGVPLRGPRCPSCGARTG